MAVTKHINVEMEQVTLKIPKPLMDFLRSAKGSKVIEWLEHEFIADIRAYLEFLGSDADELEKFLNLHEVFNAILEPSR